MTDTLRRPRGKRSSRHPLVQGVIAVKVALIEKFVRDVEAGAAPDPETLEMLAGSLKAWLAGEDARKLFPKVRGGGPIPNPKKSSRNYRMALAVETLCLDEGCSRTEAIGRIADRSKVSEATVRAALTKHREAAKRHAADMLAARKATAKKPAS